MGPRSQHEMIGIAMPRKRRHRSLKPRPEQGLNAIGHQQASPGAAPVTDAEEMILRALPLDQVDLGYLTRDRIAIERSGEHWEALKTSIAARGQQMPIEVVDLGESTRPRYGLISGLRRLLVLQELLDETGDARHARVTAILRAPDLQARDRLVAMVEENEVRAGISFYERARIAAKAAREGVFADADSAIDALFASAQRNRRYKIRCFVDVYEALDSVLWYPHAIGERLGIALARTIRAGHAETIRTALGGTGGRSMADEAAVLTRAVRDLAAPGDGATPRSVRSVWDTPGGRRITARTTPGTGRITLNTGGAEIPPATLDALTRWVGYRLDSPVRGA